MYGKNNRLNNKNKTDKRLKEKRRKIITKTFKFLNECLTNKSIFISKYLVFFKKRKYDGIKILINLNISLKIS